MRAREMQHQEAGDDARLERIEGSLTRMEAKLDALLDALADEADETETDPRQTLASATDAERKRPVTL